MYKIRIIAFLCTYLKIQSIHVIHPITIQINGFESNENIFRLQIRKFYEILLHNHHFGTKLTILLQDLVFLSNFYKQDIYSVYYAELEKITLNIFKTFNITNQTLDAAIKHIKIFKKNKKNLDLYQISEEEKNRLLHIIFPDNDNITLTLQSNFFNKDQKNHNETIPQKLKQINEIQVTGRKNVYRLSMAEELNRLIHTPINNNAQKISTTNTYKRLKEILKTLHLPDAPQSFNNKPLNKIQNANLEKAIEKLKEYNSKKRNYTKTLQTQMRFQT